MNNIEITKLSIKDVRRLQQIARQTFSEAYSAENSEADMKNYMEKSFSLEKLKEELSLPTSQFYFATVQDEPIGYLKLNTGQSQTEPEDDKAFEIERIYVLEAYQGRKVGQLLYEEAIKVSREAGAPYIWLGVWERNLRALGFYKKNGFIEFASEFSS